MLNYEKRVWLRTRYLLKVRGLVSNERKRWLPSPALLKQGLGWVAIDDRLEFTALVRSLVWQNPERYSEVFSLLIMWGWGDESGLQE